MVKKSFLWIYRVTLFALWLTIIVLASAVLTMRYLVLPHIDEYKDEIAQRASTAIGQKVSIDHIKASWDGMNPRLNLRYVEVYDKQDRPALTLSHVSTSLSWLSIPLMEPRLSRLVIHDPSLTVRREADGNIYIAGIAVGGTGKGEFANWLLRQSQIDVTNATVLWQDDLRKAPPLTLDNLDLTMVSPVWKGFVGHHSFGLRATPSAGSSQPIDVRGNFYGKDTGRLDQWRGTIYVKLEGTDIAAWRNWISYPFDLRQGHGAAQFWLDFDQGEPQQVTADVLLDNVVTRLSADSPQAVLKNLSGRLVWDKLDNGQQLRAENIRLVTADGLNMQDGNGSVIQTTVDGKQWLQGELALDEIQLQSLMAFAAYFPVAKERLQQLSDIAPEGKLQKLALSWKSDRGFPRQYSISSRFSGLGMQAYKNIPGFSNLSGDIRADESSGTLTLDTQQAMLDFRHILRWPIPADKLTGTLRWNRDGKQTTIRASDIKLANAHLAGTINGRYLLNGIKSGHLDLSAGFDRADAQYAKNYYPLILGEKTLQWLDTSILAGHSEAVDVIVKGNLHDFPFADDKLGLFKVSARVNDGVLAFSEDWPQLEKLSLDLLFQGTRMEINADDGATLGSKIIKSKVVIPVLNAASPMLQVTGDAQGTVPNGIAYINSSPLRESAGGFTESLQTAGNGKLHLELTIPIKQLDQTKVKGHYLVIDGSMGSANLPQLTRINGKLDFTETELRAERIGAWLYGGPLQFNMLSKDGAARLTAQGRVTDVGLKQAFGSSNLADRISGSTGWSGSIAIKDQQADIAIRSTLEGISANLPAPLGKIPTEKMPLLIERKQQSAQQDIIKINLDNTLSAKLLRSEKDGRLQLERGEIGFNVLPEIPQQAGLGVRGSMATLNLDEWRDLFDSPAVTADNGHISDSSRHDLGVDIRRIDLDVAVLDIFDRRIHDLKLDADADNENWRLDVKSREITGTAQWINRGDGKIIAKLQNLIIPAATQGTTELRTQGDFKQQSSHYPALDIVADNFELGTKKLGRLEVQAREQNDNWSIEKLRIANADSVLTANGEWRNWRRRPNTRMNLTWDIADVGKTLERFGHAGVIKAGKARLAGDLRWLGSPHQFEIAGLAGNLDLEATDGQILQIKPGVGRLFGVLSLQNLPRRLSFDFKDVFNRGFTFDNITAKVDIDNGIMHSDNFRMEGPAALVEIKGTTDLAKETQHLFVKVTPYISDSLAIAALAGGPVVGAAAYIAQKLLKDPLNQIAASEYEITGTWDDPNIVKESRQVLPEASPLSDGVNQ